jgi:WD40 repeat protein
MFTGKPAMQFSKSRYRTIPALLLLLLLAGWALWAANRRSPAGWIYFPGQSGSLIYLPADCLLPDSNCAWFEEIPLPVNTRGWDQFVWSPDGSRAFIRKNEASDIFKVKKDEIDLFFPRSLSQKSILRLTHIAEVVWSPDGKWLAVTGTAEDTQSPAETQNTATRLFIISSDGASLNPVAEDLPGKKEALLWRDPDSLFFEVPGDQNECDFYSLNIRDNQRTNLLQKTGCLAFPDISADGKRIAYGGASGNTDGYLINTDGSNRRLLVEMGALSLVPAWSPDQKWISLNVTGAQNHSLIYLISPQGTGLQKLYESEYASCTWIGGLEPRLLVKDNAGETRWLVISIPDGKVSPLPFPGSDGVPDWLAWRPSAP